MCLVLDVSTLVVPPETPDPDPEPEPSSSLSSKQLQNAVTKGVEAGMSQTMDQETAPDPDPQVEALLAEVQGLRQLLLYSAGLLIFCVAAPVTFRAFR